MGSGLHDFDDEPEAPNPLAATKADLEEVIRKMVEAKESAMIARERELSAIRREEEARKAAERVNQDIEEQKMRAEDKMHKAIAVAARLETARLEAENERQRMERMLNYLNDGIEPEYRPTEEDRMAARQRISYQHDKLHLAVAGAANTGKSSLINALRRLSDNDGMAAPTGPSETTFDIGRYPDPDPQLPRSRFVWYDMPGAGTQVTNDWHYFKNQGLFVFDIVILVTETIVKADTILLQHCARLNIPTFIVRSKADQHIDNERKKMENDDEDNEDEDGDEVNFLDSIYAIARQKFNSIAREKFISSTRENVRRELERAELPRKEVYIVSNAGVRLVSTHMEGGNYSSKWKKRKIRNELIDEERLIRDMLTTAYGRRYIGR
jgi:predicted GTPase